MVQIRVITSSSRNTIVQVEEDGMDIEDQVNPMEEYDNNNTVDDDGTNILIKDIFYHINEENIDDIHDVPLFEKAKQPLYAGLRKNIISSNNVFGALEGIEWFFKHSLLYMGSKFDKMF
jgi:hypothetical protein